MNNNTLFKGVLAFLGFLVFIVFYSSYFVVSEMEQVIITRFGKPVRAPITEAGLYFKFPLIEKAITIDKRILEWDGDVSNEIPTLDKKYIFVDTTARWKITDPLKFIQSVGSESGAQTRLDDIIDSATREVISRNNLVETVRVSNHILEQKKSETASIAQEATAIEKIEIGRNKLQKMILDLAKPTITEYGIELIDVQIKRIDYKDSVRQKVFERMISERKSAAEKIRSEGFGKKAEIEGLMNKDLNKIESEAYKAAQEIKGKADAEASSIYAEAYGKNPDFFAFYRTLDAYKNTIKNNFVFFLSSKGEFLEMLNPSKSPSKLISIP